MKISSSMICWNERFTIDLSLKSLVGFIDEVIIYDTGSVDGTPKTAREHIDKLGLSGEVKNIKTTNLREARLKSFHDCSGDWIIMQDAQLVFGDSLKREMTKHIKRHPQEIFSVKSLNLMGDYEHYFANRPFMAPHRIFVKRDTKYSLKASRPHFLGPSRASAFWAVNLSRVRPAWRSWYRGEPFDRRQYVSNGRQWASKYNRQRQFMQQRKYHTPIEYIKTVEGLDLEDVKEIAPQWYLRQLQMEATPLSEDMISGLPEVILEEQKNPRYKLLYENDKIVGRWPEL